MINSFCFHLGWPQGRRDRPTDLGIGRAKSGSVNEYFCRFARSTAQILGHPLAFVVALLSVITWALLGPTFHYNETWQLWINTGTTILTFLMVFLLQNTQSRDARAAQIKLDELLRAVKGARNELINIENLSEEELSRYCSEFEDLHLRYAKVLGKRGKTVSLKAAVAEVTPEQKRRITSRRRRAEPAPAV